METQLVTHLIALSERFSAARDLGEATIGRHCASDGRFFSRIRDGKTFTLRKYDEVVFWFSANWPEGVDWPTAVPRPTAREVAE